MAEKSNNPVDQWWGKVVWSVLMFGMAIWVYFDLISLASGTKTSVRVWWPIAALYNNIGFWPSVLLLPCLAMILLILGIVQFIKERN